MMSFLAMLTPYLPVLLQIIGWALKTFGASEANLKKYEQMIDDANKAGDLSVQSHDRLLSHRDAIEARLKEKQAQEGK
jgi:hypothetical protein